jgi:nucleotidyltransferase substrate binding protein (TIGR01987 family)
LKGKKLASSDGLKEECDAPRSDSGVPRRMLLDLTSFNNAIRQLEEGLTDVREGHKNQLMRDGVIQRFKCTYELGHKILRRFLEATEARPDAIAAMSFPDLIRTASGRGLLLRGWDQWAEYRKARDTTSQTYDAKKAAEVFSVIPAFLDDVRHLRDQIARIQGQR